MNYKEILSFVVNNWEYVVLMPLMINYIKTKSWDKLFKLAVKITTELVNKNISNKDKQFISEVELENSIFSKFFKNEEIKDIVKMAYHVKVKGE